MSETATTETNTEIQAKVNKEKPQEQQNSEVDPSCCTPPGGGGTGPDTKI